MNGDRDPRTQSLWDLHDFSSGRGIEVGPLFRPLVGRHEAEVHYVDIADRATLVENYRDHTGVPVEDFVDVDFPLMVDGVHRSMTEATATGAPFDWVVASHVIEHVPDLIGWLADVADLTADNGALVLVVPDKRYSFDLHRPTTTVGAMVQAHRDGDQKPSTRAVYDHFREAVDVHSDDAWAGVLPGYEARIHDDAYVAARVEEAPSVYTDCHVWVFTPDVFVAQAADLRRMGMSSWYVDRLEPTTLNQLEFLVRMRRIPRDLDPSGVRPADEVSAVAQRPEWLEDRARAQTATIETERLEVMLSEHRAHIERQAGRVRRQRQTLARQRRRIERQARRLEHLTGELDRERRRPVARARRRVGRAWRRWRRRS